MSGLPAERTGGEQWQEQSSFHSHRPEQHREIHKSELQTGILLIVVRIKVPGEQQSRGGIPEGRLSSDPPVRQVPPGATWVMERIW